MTVALIWVVIGLAALALWAFTGKDPLLWAIVALLWLRAALSLAFKVLVFAGLQYRYEIRDEVREMRAELMEEL